MDFSLVIPAYNEEDRIEQTLNTYVEYFEKNDIGFEIIVEMDGCTDRTSEIVQNISQRFSEIKYLEFEGKLGKGGGLIEGFKIAKGDCIGFVDADGAVPPEELMRLVVEAQNGTDYAIASRRVKGAEAIYHSKVRKILGRCFNIFVKTLFALPYNDTQCGAKVMKRSVMEKSISEIYVNGFAFDVIFIYLARKNGFTIKEVGVKWEDQIGSKVDVVHTTIEMFSSVVKLRLFYSPFKLLVLPSLRSKPNKVNIIESPRF